MQLYFHWPAFFNLLSYTYNSPRVISLPCDESNQLLNKMLLESLPSMYICTRANVHTYLDRAMILKQNYNSVPTFYFSQMV